MCNSVIHYLRLARDRLGFILAPSLLAIAARERKPARIAFEKKSSIGSLVDPRHFSDKNFTRTVVDTECASCLSARCVAPTRAASSTGTTQPIHVIASPPLTC